MVLKKHVVSLYIFLLEVYSAYLLLNINAIIYQIIFLFSGLSLGVF